MSVLYDSNRIDLSREASRSLVLPTTKGLVVSSYILHSSSTDRRRCHWTIFGCYFDTILLRYWLLVSIMMSVRKTTPSSSSSSTWMLPFLLLPALSTAEFCWYVTSIEHIRSSHSSMTTSSHCTLCSTTTTTTTIQFPNLSRVSRGRRRRYRMVQYQCRQL